jgi:hypothetical protein
MEQSRKRFAQPLNGDEKDRHEKDRQECGRQHAAEDDGAERPSANCAGAGREHQRQYAEDEANDVIRRGRKRIRAASSL